MKKLSKIAKTLDVYFKWGYRLNMALIILSVPLVILFFVWDNPALYQNLIQSLSFGPLTIRIADEFAAPAETARIYTIASAAISFAALPIYHLMIRCVRRILAPLKEEQPFAGAMADNLKRLGWLVCINGVVNLALNFILEYTIFTGYDMKSLLLSDRITSVTTYYKFDMTFVLLALVLFGLSYIFRYGQELQQLSDETL